jgi:hypothetical protein
MLIQNPKVLRRKIRHRDPVPVQAPTVSRAPVFTQTTALSPAPALFCFLDLPREIRDHIYTDILASSSNAVTLSPWTIEVTKSMSILRTCKQVQKECKEIIWLHNGLRLREPSQLHTRFTEVLNIMRRKEHIEITLELLDRDELEWMCSGLKALAKLPETGSLKSITLVAINDHPRGLKEYEEALELMSGGDFVDGRLFGERPNDDEHLILQTSWPHFSHWGKQRWLREMLLDRSDTTDLLQELHSIFGGKLYVDGTLCPNGIRPLNCILNPRDGEIKIMPT